MAINFTDMEKQEIAKSYELGITAKQIAKNHYCSKNVICNILKQAGAKKPPKMTEEQFQEIKQRYLQGESKEKISLDFGISVNVFSARLKNLRNACSFKISASDKIDIRDKYTAGIKVVDMATEYNVAQTAIYRALKGIEMRKAGRNKMFSDEKEFQIFQEFEAGENYQVLGNRHGASPMTIKNIVRRQNEKQSK